jgi:hypothetical protein
MDSVTRTDEVRKHVCENYIEVARRRGERTVRVVAGDVHRALQLRNRVPLVCNALLSPALLADGRMQVVNVEGPPSGQSTTVTVTYQLDPELAANQGSPGERRPAQSPIWELRGIAKTVFNELGGGEAFIRAERERFFGAQRARRSPATRRGTRDPLTRAEAPFCADPSKAPQPE